MLLFVLAIIQSILYGWLWGVQKGEAEAHQGAHLRMPPIVKFILKYVSPVYLLAVFFGSILLDGPGYWKKLNAEPIAAVSFGLILLVFAFFLVTVHIAGNRWNAGKRPRWPDYEVMDYK